MIVIFALMANSDERPNGSAQISQMQEVAKPRQVFQSARRQANPIICACAEH